ncbi:MAG: type IV secretory pathway ATPase VirB11/archaellum biosynthesis ATPase [Porticoccus sp.]|jgi:type IV secretory pathway ATPase VirB11/archaellum biosynthesis ATPase
MRTGEELALAMVAGEMRMISGSTKSLVERTMEAISSELNNQAQVQSQGEQYVQ